MINEGMWAMAAMKVRTDAVGYEGNTVNFFTELGDGSLYRTTATVLELTELMRDLGRLRDALERHNAEMNVADLFELRGEVLDRILADVQSAPTLERRIEAAEMVAALDDAGAMLVDGDWDGLS